MDYGERQGHAELLVKGFRSQPSKSYRDCKGVLYTYAQIADEIEGMTDLGRDLVALAGLVLQAVNSPHF